MKLVSFGPRGSEKPGVITDNNTILDIRAASENKIMTARQVIEMGPAGLEELERLLAGPSRGNAEIPLDGTRLGPPITNPSKIVAVGLNYRSHTGEQDILKAPKVPLLFSKGSNCLNGDRDPIWYPVEENNVDYEVELGVVIGKPSFRIDPDHWEEHVFGYTIVNDVSGRDTQFSDKKWFRGKSYDTFCPVGPCIVTRDQIPDPQNLALGSTLNGERRQEGNTSDMIFDLPHLLSFISRNITLQPGDIISTGTPGGVGIFMDPPSCMSVGDEIAATVEKIGTLTNFVAERVDYEPSVYPHP